jgi:hypothetical protein
MELVVYLSTSLREVLGPIHKETCYGVDGFKNRPSVQVGVRADYPYKHGSAWIGLIHEVQVGTALGHGYSRSSFEFAYGS